MLYKQRLPIDRINQSYIRKVDNCINKWHRRRYERREVMLREAFLKHGRAQWVRLLQRWNPRTLGLWDEEVERVPVRGTIDWLRHKAWWIGVSLAMRAKAH